MSPPGRVPSSGELPEPGFAPQMSQQHPGSAVKGPTEHGARRNRDVSRAGRRALSASGRWARLIAKSGLGLVRRRLPLERKSLLFIFGCQRSGTTLMTRIFERDRTLGSSLSAVAFRPMTPSCGCGLTSWRRSKRCWMRRTIRSWWPNRWSNHSRLAGSSTISRMPARCGSIDTTMTSLPQT